VASACYLLSEIRIPLLRIRIALVQFSFSVFYLVQAGFQCFSENNRSGYMVVLVRGFCGGR
jgi:hypothetical protein